MQLTLEENQVYTFKLSSGEELIAKVLKNEDNHTVIEEPVSVAPGPQGMGLVPSLFTADPKAVTRLNNSTIAVVAKTDESVTVKYLEATTGIKVPEKKLILG
jgi:hypothetical protein